MPECRACGALIDPGSSVCSECGTPSVGATESFEPVGVPDGSKAGASAVSDGPVLIVRKGPQSGERFYLDRPRLTVGRDPASDIFLNDNTVSRAHAILETIGGEVTIRDEASLNGTYLNGVIVDEAILSHGDVVQVGTFQMVFLAGPGAAS